MQSFSISRQMKWCSGYLPRLKQEAKNFLKLATAHVKRYMWTHTEPQHIADLQAAA